jgi:hypothetical protein
LRTRLPTERVMERRDNQTHSSVSSPIRLPKRDYFLLPLLSFLTVLLMFGVSEILTRLIWVQHNNHVCVIEDPVAGDQFKPNCTERAKLAEGPWVTYSYNNCGYRSVTPCGPKPAGTIRIAITGSSMSQALHVPYQDTFFDRASRELTSRCGRPVDVQNLGVPGLSPIYAYRRIPEALSLQPDVVLYLVTPFDLEQKILPGELAERDNPTRISPTPAAKLAANPLRDFEHLLIQSRTILVAQHFIFQNRETFIRVFMVYGDRADFLRQPLTPAWQQRFADFDVIVDSVAEKLRAAGVPLIIIPVPSRVEAALLSSPQLPPRVDPYAFGREVEAIASKHGADYLDLMKPISGIPNAENLYYIVDGHVTADGHDVIAEELVRKLLDGSVPAFSQCALRQTAERSQ